MVYLIKWLGNRIVGTDSTANRIAERIEAIENRLDFVNGRLNRIIELIEKSGKQDEGPLAQKPDGP